MKFKPGDLALMENLDFPKGVKVRIVSQNESEIPDEGILWEVYVLEKKWGKGRNRELWSVPETVLHLPSKLHKVLQ